MKYVLGLDLGISSVGWAVLNLSDNRIEDLGVRAFSAAENPKNKESLAMPRRIARGARRRLRRRKGRMVRIRKLFIEAGFVAAERLDALFAPYKGQLSPWELRAEGLDRLLNAEQFARALYHIAKHRGFKSNSKAALNDARDQKADKDADDDGKAKAAIEQNTARLKQSPYRTAGEMVVKDDVFKARKRNTTGDYSKSIDRIMLLDETRVLFAKQRELGNSLASLEVEKQFVDLFSWQMPFASGDSILDKVGPCTFESGEKRAPRNAYTTERFTVLGKINQIAWFLGGDRVEISDEQRVLVDRLSRSLKQVTYTQLRKELGLPQEARFVALTYLRRAKPAPKAKGTGNETNGPIDADTGLVEDLEFKCETAVFARMPGYHAIKDIAVKAGVWEELQRNPDALDDIAHALTFYKTDDDIAARLTAAGMPEALIEHAIASSGFSQVSHLSLVAMRKIIPHLEAGLVYSEACARAGYDHSSPGGPVEKSYKLPVIDPETIRNPVVLRCLTQARKVLNAVIDRYGSPTRVHIELARELGKSVKDRRDIEKKQEDNRRAAQRFDEEFAELHNQPPKNGEERLKWRLYREQGGQCAYSHRPLDLENRFYEPGYVEIDHILPYSKSFDDSMSNKVLVLSAENQMKRNSTPHQYFGANEERWDKVEAWVTANIKDPRKRQKLLTRDYKGQERDEWLPRNLVDTRYITREFASFVRSRLLFADESEKLPVVCLSGGITSLLRGVWGLAKVREKDDLHHAMDAAVIASVTPRTVQLLTRFRQDRECTPWKVGENWVDPETGELIEFKYSFPQPWKKFRDEIIARLDDDPQSRIAALNLPTYVDVKELKPVLVSRMPQRKVSGAIHKETIKSARLDDEGKRVAVKRVALTQLKLADLARLYDPKSNTTFYAAIRGRLEQFGGDGEKAFAEPLYKPGKNGTQGPQVRQVKVVESQPSGVEVRGGVADNGDMVRVDVYSKGGKHFIVPVYASQLMSGKLPQRAISAHKPEEQWDLITGDFAFVCSLYPFDLVRVVTKDEEFTGYYRSTDRDNAKLTVSAVNSGNVESIRRLSSKTALSIEKQSISILGVPSVVTGEPRRGLENDSHLESGEAED
ncbi:MAG TPA: type II CRISPR RNA-guided endonuclease Cas9 [Capsulimonadaceae bacterium]|jgi:CRISPR-associated endonuclease Csn1